MPFLLPPEPATDVVCVSISIPNTEQDIRNFLGQLLTLSFWFNYERTGTDLGKQVADTWRDAMAEVLIGACMIVRQDPENPCILQTSTDDGDTWTEFADITLCVDSDYIRSLIAGDTSLQQYIASIANQTLYPSGTQGEVASILTTDIISPRPDCDLDNIFGMSTGLVDLLNQVSEDILELFVTAFATPSRLGDIIEAIPGVGELPIDDILQMTEKMAEAINDAYQAAYDTQLRDDFRCDLFCIAQDTCELTIEDARDYFQGKLANTVSNADFNQVIEDIILNNWLGEQSVYVMHWLILQTIIFGGEILGIDHNRIAIQINALFNDPDPDWSILCACATEWQVTFDFTIDEQGWSVVGSNGNYVPGTGFRSVNNSSNESRNYFQYDTALGEYHVTRATVVGTWAGDSSPSYMSNSLLGGDGSGGNVLLGRNTFSSTPDSDVIDMDSDGDEFMRWQTYATGFSPTPSNASIYTITHLTIRGTGVNPFL